ncbi:hypothetical protein R6Q59_018362 [Mikania micrantha]
MTQPSNQASPNNLVSVIGSQFIGPHPFEVIFVRNPSGDHLITDVNHNTMFKVERRSTSYHEQRLLLDADDIPIVLIRKKMLSAHSRWKAYKGNSSDDSDFIFSTKTSKIMHSKTDIHVFLTNKNHANKNHGKDSCDFKITGSWSNKSCTIYMGDSSTIIAQIHKMEASENVNKGNFMVKIYPHVDYAFVVTLTLIIESMKGSDAEHDNVGQVIGDVGESIGDMADIFVTMFS